MLVTYISILEKNEENKINLISSLKKNNFFMRYKRNLTKHSNKKILKTVFIPKISLYILYIYLGDNEFSMILFFISPNKEL